MSKPVTSNRARITIAFNTIISRANKIHGSSEYTAQSFADLGREGPPSLRLKSGRYLFTLSDEDSDADIAAAQTIAEIYDLSFLMLEQGVDSAWSYLTEVVIPKLNEQWEVLNQNVRTFTVTPYSEVIFLSPLLEEQRHREDIAIALNKDEGALTDVASCLKCAAPKVLRKIAQTRSADEGATSIFKCPRCKFGWNEN